MYVRFFKRLLDCCLAALGLPFLAVVFLPITIAIYLDDKGPPLYRATRVGRGMKSFVMLKFRTMIVDAPDLRNSDGSTVANRGDYRITRVGRYLRATSLDELPQLINVLRGDMSLVGPRPSPPGNRDRYPVEYLQKFSIRPGITGYAQARLRNTASMHERIEHDLFYVANISFRLDLAILRETIGRVTSRGGVYKDE